MLSFVYSVVMERPAYKILGGNRMQGKLYTAIKSLMDDDVTQISIHVILKKKKVLTVSRFS